MNFQVRTLGDIKNEQKRDYEQARRSFRRHRRPLKFYFLVPLCALVVFLALRTLAWTWERVRSFSVVDKVWELASDIKIENNHTNILLLGHSGGNHDGPDLTDTIIVASLNHELKTVSLLSLPRDLFVSVAGYVPARINAVWKLGQMRHENDEEGFELIRGTVEAIIGQPLHYHARVNFDGFVDVIDILGGLEVEVETAFTDHDYPTKDFGWQTITFTRGFEKMDGERALQFARSRHGNNGQGSDFQRALRQQKILQAVREKALNDGLLTQPEKLKRLYETTKKYIQTDIGTRELLALAKFATEIGRDRVFSFSLTDGEDGFLYTPSDEERATFYNGWFVLLPLGNNWNLIQKFTNIIWNRGTVFLEGARIRILNGTGRAGLASSCKMLLERYHLQPLEVGNASSDFLHTQIYDHTDNQNPATAQLLEELTAGQVVLQNPEPAPTSADVTVILGADTTCHIF